MKNKHLLPLWGFALVEIMLIVATTTLVAVFSIPKFLRTKVSDNVSAVQVILKTVSTAIENYVIANNGEYPTSVMQLITPATEDSPPYLNENYCDGRIRNGYLLSCSFSADNKGYVLTARPRKCGVTGDKSFTMITGGVLFADACQTKKK